MAIWEALMFSASTFLSSLKYSISRSQYLAEYKPRFDWGQYGLLLPPVRTRQADHNPGANGRILAAPLF